MSKRFLQVLVIGLALALLGTPTATAADGTGRASAVEAAAKKKTVKTATSFGLTSWGGEAALGTVSSKNANCVKNRKVKLYLVRPGKSRKLVGIDKKTGSPAGNGDGYWVIPTNLKVDKKYQAVVTKRVVGKVTCKAYTTSKVKYAG